MTNILLLIYYFSTDVCLLILALPTIAASFAIFTTDFQRFPFIPCYSLNGFQLIEASKKVPLAVSQQWIYIVRDL